MAGVVGTHLLAQVGFIVKDIEESKKKWAAFLGVEVPETQPREKKPCVMPSASWSWRID